MGSLCLGSPPVHGENGSKPSGDDTHCDSVKAMFGTAPRSELWSMARTVVPWHRHRRRSPGATAARTGSVGSPRRELCLLIPHSHRLCHTPSPTEELWSLMEIQDLPSEVSRPQLCDPMIPGDLLLQGGQDSETLCPVSPFPPFYIHSTA